MSIDSATYTHFLKGPRCQSHHIGLIASFQKTEIDCFGGMRELFQLLQQAEVSFPVGDRDPAAGGFRHEVYAEFEPHFR
jgi:hypothetical protein